MRTAVTAVRPWCSLVQFVVDKHTMEPFAAKFFMRESAYRRELRLYEIPPLGTAMPRLVHAADVRRVAEVHAVDAQLNALAAVDAAVTARDAVLTGQRKPIRCRSRMDLIATC